VPVTGLFSCSIVNGAYNLIFAGSPSMPNIDTFSYRDASFYPNFLQANHLLMDATNPDLSAFHKAGGKLILWHGGADQHISPLFTINYYEAMQNTMGASSVDAFARLYLMPGAGQCGGEGFSNIDRDRPQEPPWRISSSHERPANKPKNQSNTVTKTG
jgi:hypothetical protein